MVENIFKKKFVEVREKQILIKFEINYQIFKKILIKNPFLHYDLQKVIH